MKTSMKASVLAVFPFFGWLFLLPLFLSPTMAISSDAVPPCMSRSTQIPIDNVQVLKWKVSTPNQYRARGHVLGRIEKIYADHSGHDHFAIQIGNTPNHLLEVIYNKEFGALPQQLAVGMQVEACGDYITSKAQSGPYPPSPVGAIIHWVHVNPSGNGHESGFLVIDGILYGYGQAPHRLELQSEMSAISQ